MAAATLEDIGYIVDSSAVEFEIGYEIKPKCVGFQHTPHSLGLALLAQTLYVQHLRAM